MEGGAPQFDRRWRCTNDWSKSTPWPVKNRSHPWNIPRRKWTGPSRKDSDQDGCLLQGDPSSVPAGTRIHHPRTNRSRSSYWQELRDSSRALQSSSNSINISPRIRLINRLRFNSALDSGGECCGDNYCSQSCNYFFLLPSLLSKQFLVLSATLIFLTSHSLFWSPAKY